MQMCVSFGLVALAEDKQDRVQESTPNPQAELGVGVIPKLDERMLKWCVCLPTYSPNKRLLAFHANGQGDVKVYAADTKQLLWSYPTAALMKGKELPWPSIWHYSWSPNNDKLAVGLDGSVVILKAETGELLYQTSKPRNRFFDVKWSPDGKFLAAIGGFLQNHDAPPKVLVWDAATWDVRREIPVSSGSSIAWSPDSTHIAFNGDGIQIWDISANKMTLSLQVPHRGNAPFSWSPDGRDIVVGDLGTNYATIFSAASGEPINRYQFEEIMHIDWLDHNRIRCIGDTVQMWTLPIDAAGNIQRVKIKHATLGDKGYIPKDIDECFKQLDSELPAKSIQEIKDSPEDKLILFHHGLGMWMRNSWGLWSGSGLAKYFWKLGVKHPDDISMLIIRCYWRHLHAQPVDLQQLIQQSTLSN